MTPTSPARHRPRAHALPTFTHRTVQRPSPRLPKSALDPDAHAHNLRVLELYLTGLWLQNRRR